MFVCDGYPDALGPAWPGPALPAPGVGEGEGGGGEEPLQVLQAPHHLPVLLGPRHAGRHLLDLLLPHGDPPVLVD